MTTGPVDRVKLVAVSCQEYINGYFNPWHLIAQQDDIDAVVHLGDYIYEYGPTGYTSETTGLSVADVGVPERLAELQPQSELLQLGDYRLRYATYKSDPDLQEAHRKFPFICVWDDHEVANDTWREGAQNHSEDEGDFFERKRVAIQAFFEWVPIRPVMANYRGSSDRIFRSYQFGDLVDLHMLDTRQFDRDQQLSITGPELIGHVLALDEPAVRAEIENAGLSTLGDTQKNWLETQMAMTTATWTVLGSQLVTGPQEIPFGLAFNIFPGSPEGLQMLPDEYLQNVADGITSAEEPLMTPFPYNLDSWDGYPQDRAWLSRTAAAYDKNLVVLYGDMHSGWAHDIMDETGNHVGVGVGGPSISSPTLEFALGLGAEEGFTIDTVERFMRHANPELRHLNAFDHGYVQVTFTRYDAVCDFVYIDTIKSRNYAVKTAANRSFRVLPGSAGRRLEEI